MALAILKYYFRKFIYLISIYFIAALQDACSTDIDCHDRNLLIDAQPMKCFLAECICNVGFQPDKENRYCAQSSGNSSSESIITEAISFVHSVYNSSTSFSSSCSSLADGRPITVSVVLLLAMFVIRANLFP